MKIIDEIKLSGKLHVDILNVEGDVIESFDADNLITNAGYMIAGQCLAGMSGAAINRIGIGTNATAPAVTDTALTNAVFGGITGVQFSTPGAEPNEWVRFNFAVGYFSGVGINIVEWGLITQDGRLFSRLTRSAIQKTNEMMLVGSWTINL